MAFFWELIWVLGEDLHSSFFQENCCWWQCVSFNNWRKGHYGEIRSSQLRRRGLSSCFGPDVPWGQYTSGCTRWQGLPATVKRCGDGVCMGQSSRWRAYFLGDAKNESKRSLSKDGMQFIIKCKTACSGIVHWWARGLHLVDWEGKRGVLLSKHLWALSSGRKRTPWKTA